MFKYLFFAIILQFSVLYGRGDQCFLGWNVEGDSVENKTLVVTFKNLDHLENLIAGHPGTNFREVIFVRDTNFTGTAEDAFTELNASSQITLVPNRIGDTSHLPLLKREYQTFTSMVDKEKISSHTQQLELFFEFIDKLNQEPQTSQQLIENSSELFIADDSLEVEEFKTIYTPDHIYFFGPTLKDVLGLSQNIGVYGPYGQKSYFVNMEGFSKGVFFNLTGSNAGIQLGSFGQYSLPGNSILGTDF